MRQRKHLRQTLAILCGTVLLTTAAYAADPVEVPPIPDADGAVAVVHDFENGEFDNLFGASKKTDALGNQYQYKSGSDYASVENAPDGTGHEGKVLRLNGNSGSDAYMLVVLKEEIRQRCVISFDVMTDTKPGSGRKEILKIAENETANSNRVIDFLSTGKIQSNGANFALHPDYEVNKWYHFDVILHFTEADGSNTVIVQLTAPDGKVYRQDYNHNAALDRLKSFRIASKSGFGSVYIDNLSVYKDVPSDFVMDISGAPQLVNVQNNTENDKTFLFCAMLYTDEGQGAQMADIYVKKLELKGGASVDIDDCALNPGQNQTLYYRLWDISESGKITQIKEKQL